MLDGLKRPIGRPPGGAFAAGQTSADLLIDAAIVLFAHQNYWAVSVKDIAQKAGLNASLIYYYFGSKDELFLAVIETMIARSFASFEEMRGGAARRPDEVVVLWIENHARSFPLLRKLLLLSVDYARMAARVPRIDRAIRSFYDREAQVLRDAIEAGIATGQFRRMDVPAVVAIISTVLDGAMVRSITLSGYDAPAAIEALSDYVMARLADNA